MSKANRDGPDIKNRRMRFRRLSLANLPFMVLEHAHWRPQAAKLRGKDKPTLRKRPDQEVLKDYQLLRLAWAREETWINYSFQALLMALPPVILSKLFAQIADEIELKNAGFARLGSAGLSKIVGEPDVVVLDSTHCFLIELKVKAQTGSHRYSFPQYAKYMALSAICEVTSDAELSRKPRHILIVPDKSSREFCSDFEYWNPAVHKGKLRIDPRNTRTKTSTKFWQEYSSWQVALKEQIGSSKVARKCAIDSDKLDRLALGTIAELAPTYVVTWGELVGNICALCGKAGLTNHVVAAEELLKMANGDWKPDLLPG